MSQLAFDLPGVEDGRRTETVEYAIRYQGNIEPTTEHHARWLTSAEAQDELPYLGYPLRGLQLMTRTIVHYTGSWQVEGSTP